MPGVKLTVHSIGRVNLGGRGCKSKWRSGWRSGRWEGRPGWLCWQARSWLVARGRRVPSPRRPSSRWCRRPSSRSTAALGPPPCSPSRTSVYTGGRKRSPNIERVDLQPGGRERKNGVCSRQIKVIGHRGHLCPEKQAFTQPSLDPSEGTICVCGARRRTVNYTLRLSAAHTMGALNAPRKFEEDEAELHISFSLSVSLSLSQPPPKGPAGDKKCSV